MFVTAFLLGATPLVCGPEVESAALPLFLPSMREFLEISAGTEIAFRSRSLDYDDGSSGSDGDADGVTELQEAVATMHFDWDGLRYREVVQEVIEGELQTPRVRHGVHSYLDGMSSSSDHSYGSGTTWTQSSPWRSFPKAAWYLSGRYLPLGQDVSLLWDQPVDGQSWEREARFFLPRKEGYASLFYDSDPARLHRVEVRDREDRLARRVDYGAPLAGPDEDVVVRPAVAIESLFREDGSCRSARAWLRLESGHLTTGPETIVPGTVVLLGSIDGRVEADIVRSELSFDELPGWIESTRRERRIDALRAEPESPGTPAELVAQDVEPPASPASEPASRPFLSHLGSGALLVVLGLVLLIRKSPR